MSKNITIVSAVVLILVVAIIGISGVYKGKNVQPVAEKSAVGKLAKSLEKVKVQAGWLLNGEFANICASVVNGYYKDEGLDVEMVPGGPSGASFTIATNAIAQDPSLTIGVDGDVVPLLRGITKESESEKLRVKAFAAFWNDNPYGFMVRKDSGITSIKDFAKRKPGGSKYKIGVTADSVIQYAIADYIGIPVKDLDIVIVGFDATPFLTGEVDALAGYWTTQAYEAEKAGIPYAFLNSSEIPGFKQPSMVAVATDKTLKEKPDVLVRWLRATIKGTKFVEGNPEVTGKFILDDRCGGKTFNVEQETWLIKKSLPLFDQEKIGWIYNEQIMGFANAYYALRQIPRVPEQSEVIDYSILGKLYTGN